MNYFETPEDLLAVNTRDSYREDISDVIETVMHTYKYIKLLDTESIGDISNVPVTFMYKYGFAVPIKTSIPTENIDNINSRRVISDFLYKNNYDYSIHIRSCYGLYYSEDDFDERSFQEKFSQYKATIKLIEQNKISDTSVVDELLRDFKSVSATCIDRQGIKYQVLLSMNRLDEFENFIEIFIDQKSRVNLNEVFNQDFISFAVNMDREFENIAKSQFHCIPENEFALNVKPF